MGQKDFVISIMVIGMFAVAIMGFALQFGIDNSSVVRITDDPELNNLKIVTTNNISGMRSSSEESYTSIVQSSITSGDNIESGGTFALTITKVIPTLYGILSVAKLKIFGDGLGFQIFFSGFITIIGFLGVMAFAKMWLGRNPD